VTKTILTNEAFLRIMRQILKRAKGSKEADQLLDQLFKHDSAAIMEAAKEKADAKDPRRGG
jgi:histone H3/H4